MRVQPRRVRFWFGSHADIDEARVVLQYPPTLGSARFSVRLYHRRRPDPDGLPLSTAGGIQIGALFDIVPDDGDYSEVYEVEDVKLRVEDVDIVERSLFVGQVEEGGGLAGPVAFHVDNDFGGVDADQDNGFDLNGVISPIPTSGPLEQLTWRSAGLVSDASDADRIEPEQIRVDGLPMVLARGQRQAADVSVDVPAATPIGVYRGRLDVFEDNNLDGMLTGGEPLDGVIVTVVVGVPPDGGIDLGPPDSAVDAAVDGGPEAGAEDAGDAVVPGDADAAEVPDSTPDAGRDGGPFRDLGGDFSDGGRGRDGGAGFELGSPRGGAFSCSTSAGTTSAGPPLPLPLFAALFILALWRRRRA